MGQVRYFCGRIFPSCTLNGFIYSVHVSVIFIGLCMYVCSLTTWERERLLSANFRVAPRCPRADL